MIEYPKVTVNILTYNRKEEVTTTINKILNIDYPKNKLEIIVVDNASTDGTWEYLKKIFSNIQLLKSDKNVGISGWNIGFEVGTGEYYLVLDDDCHIEGETLKNAISFLSSNKEYGIVSFNVIDPNTKYSYTQYLPLGIFSLWGCAVLISSDILKNIGGFDSNIFLYAHEPEFLFRAFKNGYKHKIMISEFAFHRKNPELAINKGFNSNIYFSELYTYFKHFNGYRFFMFLLGVFLEALYKDFKNIFKMRRKDIYLKILLKAFILGRKNKSQIQKDVESLFFKNDIRVFEKSLFYFFLRRLPKRFFYRKYLLSNFIKKRIEYFPDFDENLFLELKPVSIRRFGV